MIFEKTSKEKLRAQAVKAGPLASKIADLIVKENVVDGYVALQMVLLNLTLQGEPVTPEFISFTLEDLSQIRDHIRQQFN